MATDNQYPPEVKESILLKALESIARARTEKRLSWNGKVVNYTAKDGVKYKKTIDEMPAWFMTMTGAGDMVTLLVGNISADLKDIFVKVLSAKDGELDIDKIGADITAKMDVLRKLAEAEKLKDK